MARLEECLRGINSRPGALRGSIDALIQQNKKTKKQKSGSRRLCSSGIEIAQASDLADRSVKTQALERRFPGPALYHTILGYQNGLVQKTIVPLQFLLKGWGDASRGFQCYIHTISEKLPDRMVNLDALLPSIASATDYTYVGITGRNWLRRLDEHVREMHQGNKRNFYRAWRERCGMTDVLFTSYLRDINLSYQGAMNWEEKNVDKLASDEFGLNMIPGGFKGFRFLHEHRITDRVNIALKDRDKAIQEFVRQNPRKGVPNPFIAELWKDDEFYLKVMKARPKTLTPDQVRKIRKLAELGQAVPKIVKEVGALNERQVRDVISGKYYGRIQ